ncbi:MAG: hypothetical protein ABIJ57_05950 [Pseudomonadota bacterium]
MRKARTKPDRKVLTVDKNLFKRGCEAFGIRQGDVAGWAVKDDNTLCLVTNWGKKLVFKYGDDPDPVPDIVKPPAPRVITGPTVPKQRKPNKE